MTNRPLVFISLIFSCLAFSCPRSADLSAIQRTVSDFRAAISGHDMETAERIMPDGDLSQQVFIDVLLSELPADGNVRISKTEDVNRYLVDLPSFKLEAVRGIDGAWVLSPYILRTQTIDFIPAEN